MLKVTKQGGNIVAAKNTVNRCYKRVMFIWNIIKQLTNLSIWNVWKR